MNGIRDFGIGVDRLIRGEDLTRAEAFDMFSEVLQSRQPELQQGAFLAALTAKGATPDEIAGGCEAIYEIDTVKVYPDVSPLCENCGTGMDAIKTFNISTAAAVVAAADGVKMARHGARAITSKCGTVDLAEALGVDVECSAEVVRRSIESAGIGLFNGMSPKIHPRALFRILSQIGFGTVLNIAGSLANPAAPSLAVRGVSSRKMIMPAAMAMREMGFKRALIVHGLSADGLMGMDEVSVLGDTFAAEVRDGEIEEMVITLKDLGVTQGREGDILAGPDRGAEVRRMIAVLSGEEGGSREDAVCANAAAILYVAGHVPDIPEGLERARDIIDSGRAVKRLRMWVVSQQGSDAGDKIDRLDEAIEACAGY